MITGLFAAFFAVWNVFLMVQIIRRRFRFQVSLGDGGHDELNRFVRTHGNFLEIVPFALILMGLLELQNASGVLLYSLGGLLIFSRVMHYLGMNTTLKVYGRQFGTASAMVVFLAAAGWLIALSPLF